MTNTINKNGVRILPTRSTTFEGTMENNQVIAKKRMDVQIGLLFGKEGSTPTSKVVAAVRGSAINGPIQIMMTDPSIAARFLLMRCPKSLKSSPELVTDSTPKKGSRIPVNPKAKIVIHIWLPTCMPINGGRSKFPAPKNI